MIKSMQLIHHEIHLLHVSKIGAIRFLTGRAMDLKKGIILLILFQND